MDKIDSDQSDQQLKQLDRQLPAVGQHLLPLEVVDKDVVKDVSHESPEQIVAKNVSQQLLSNAFEFERNEKESQDLVKNLETSGQSLEEQLLEEPFHQNIEYHSEQRFSGQPIQQYIYDEEEEDEEEEEEEDEDELEFYEREEIKVNEDMIGSNISPNRRTETIDDLMNQSIGSQNTTKDEILYQLSDENVLTAQSYGIGSDLRIDCHSDQSLGEVSEYQLNSEDPFSTPHKQKTESKRIEENFEKFVENCEPFETIATDFQLDPIEQKNNLLDLDLGMAQMSNISDEHKEFNPLLESMPDYEPNPALNVEPYVEFSEESYVVPSGAEDIEPIVESLDDLNESYIHSTNRSDTQLSPTLSPNLDTFEPTLTQTSHHFEDTQQLNTTSAQIETIEESPIDPIFTDESSQQSKSETLFTSKLMAKQEVEHAVNTSTTATTNSNCPFGPIAELVYWRDPKKSGIVFGAGLAILLALTVFSIISVVAYASLAALSVTISFRIYKNILQAVQKTNEGHPFKEYLEIEITPSSDRIHQIVDSVLLHTNCSLNKLRSVFLVEDIIDSLKFVVLFWCLTYIGSWFNGLTLIILAYLGLFSLPKVYELNKSQIDLYLTLASTQINEITSKIRAKIPFPAKKDKDN